MLGRGGDNRWNVECEAANLVQQCVPVPMRRVQVLLVAKREQVPPDTLAHPCFKARHVSIHSAVDAAPKKKCVCLCARASPPLPLAVPAPLCPCPCLHTCTCDCSLENARPQSQLSARFSLARSETSAKQADTKRDSRRGCACVRWCWRREGGLSEWCAVHLHIEGKVRADALVDSEETRNKLAVHVSWGPVALQQAGRRR